MIQLFTLHMGTRFTIPMYPFIFTVAKPFRDTVGSVEVTAVGLEGSAHLTSLMEVVV